MKLGVMISGERMSIHDTVALAQRAEAAGFDSVWVPDYYQSWDVPMALIAAETSRVELGVGVTMGFSRSPFVNARIAADLDELCGGRLILGVGSATLHPGREDSWIPGRKRPGVAGFRHMVEALRHAWRTWYDEPGAPLEYESEDCVLRVPGLASTNRPMRREIPLYLGVRQPKLLQLTGEIADGFVTFPTSCVRYNREEVLPQIEIGAKRVGRDPRELEFTGIYICVVDEDREKARRLARRQISFFVVDGASYALFEREGFGPEVEQITAAWKADDVEAMVEAVTDEMLDTFVLSGDIEEVRARVAELGELVDHVIVHAVSFGLDSEQILSEHGALIEAFS